MPLLATKFKRKTGIKVSLKSSCREMACALFKKYAISPPANFSLNDGAANSFIQRVVSHDGLSRKKVISLLCKSLQKTIKRPATYGTDAKPSSKTTEPNYKKMTEFFRLDYVDLLTISCLPATKFYKTPEWRSLRYFTIKDRGNKCECCGCGPDTGTPIHVDHILPRSIYTEHALNPDNLQVLCEDCNLAKSNTDTSDWRECGDGGELA